MKFYCHCGRSLELVSSAWDANHYICKASNANNQKFKIHNSLSIDYLSCTLDSYRLVFPNYGVTVIGHRHDNETSFLKNGCWINFPFLNLSIKNYSKTLIDKYQKIFKLKAFI